MTTKSMLRAEALARRRALSAAERERASTAIQNTLLRLLERRRLNEAPLLVYRAMNSEVDTRRILARPHPAMYAPAVREHRMLWLRVSPETRWSPGGMGVLEPDEGDPWTPETGEAALVCPLAGFDRAGNRLGLGKGCFDRWLGDHREHVGLVIGLAFACQELPSIPAEAHDQPLDLVITERELITCRKP
jgi:5-formyltetrahydrofolate cyclo-ligase